MSHGERFNSLSHLVGLGLAVVGAILLIVQAAQGGSAVQILSFSVFGLTMIALYAASTLFHGFEGANKNRWAKADHCAIYLLIAGTYTPFTLVTLRGSLGFSLFLFVWSLAFLGILRELRSGDNASPSLVLYLLMGWCGLGAVLPLVQKLHGQGWKWLLAGCLSYSIGVVFYLLGQRLRHSHGIWHLFVLGGTASHFVTVLKYVT